MSAYPEGHAERQQVRGHKIKAEIEAAKFKALWLVVSLKCSSSHHADEPYGCGNDGSTCLCECHDHYLARGSDV